MRGDPQVVVRWERLTGQILEATRSFPKAVRHTFTRRVDDRALDVLEHLVGAQYASRAATAEHLERADGALARLRILLRLAHQQHYLSHGAYEALSRELDEAGRMLGGWRRSQAGPPRAPGPAAQGAPGRT